MLLEPQSETGFLEQAVQGYPFVKKGRGCSFLWKNYMCMLGKKICVVVLGICINAEGEVRAHFHSSFQSHMAQG